MNQSQRFDPFDVHRAVDEITRSFPPTYVEVARAIVGESPERQQTLDLSTIVYKGSALVVPASALLVRAPLGEIAAFALTILIAGKYDIRQMDFVTNEDILYQIDFPPQWLHGFMGLKLKRYSQLQ